MGHVFVASQSSCRATIGHVRLAASVLAALVLAPLAAWGQIAVPSPPFPSNGAGEIVRCVRGTEDPPSGPVLRCQLTVRQTFTIDARIGQRVACVGGGRVEFDAAGKLRQCQLAVKQVFRRAGKQIVDCVAGGPEDEGELADSTMDPGGFHASFFESGALAWCHIGPMTPQLTAARTLVSCYSPDKAWFSASTGALLGCTLFTKTTFTVGTQYVSCMAGGQVVFNEPGRLIQCTMPVRQTFRTAQGMSVTIDAGQRARFDQNGNVIAPTNARAGGGGGTGPSTSAGTAPAGPYAWTGQCAWSYKPWTRTNGKAVAPHSTKTYPTRFAATWNETKRLWTVTLNDIVLYGPAQSFGFRTCDARLTPPCIRASAQWTGQVAFSPASISISGEAEDRRSTAGNRYPVLRCSGTASGRR